MTQIAGDQWWATVPFSQGSAFVEQAPTRIAKGLARHSIPVILPARMADVDTDEKGTGLGKALLKDALP